MPVVWKERLFLFWLRILKQGPSEAQKPGNPGQLLTELTTDSLNAKTRITVQAILCWSEFFNGKWQPTRTSDVEHPLSLGDYDASENLCFRAFGVDTFGTALHERHAASHHIPSIGVRSFVLSTQYLQFT